MASTPWPPSLLSKLCGRATSGFFSRNVFRTSSSWDPKLFESGIDYIEQKTGRPVFGLMPFFKNIFIDSEDSVVVQEDKRKLTPLTDNTVNIAVLRLPGISNFTDLEILSREPDIVLNFLFQPREMVKSYDLLILPGTKNVVEDARWLNRTGWKKTIREFAKQGGRCLGICGGYQLLGEIIKDPYGVESNWKKVKGLGLLPVETNLEQEKIVRKINGVCLLNEKRITGYEIHMGKTRNLRDVGSPYLRIHKTGGRQSWEDGWFVEKGKIAGTYVHGLLDSPSFRSDFLNGIRREKGLKERSVKQGRAARFHQYDLLADLFEANCDVERIIKLI